MEDRDKKAIELANDTTKQILTLSTGIVFLSIAFKKDFVPESFNGILAVRVLIFAWFLYLCSIMAGVLTLLFLTGEVGRTDGTMPSIYDAKIRYSHLGQLLTFFTATLLILIFGVMTV
jgi:hypothetical protein